MSRFDKLTDREIARWRLHNQCLVGEGWTDPVAVVRNMLAVQAENVGQSGWALAVRCDPRPSETGVQEHLDAGRILRTHIIRPTWHYVLPDDIVWLTELSAARIQRSFVSSQQLTEGISDEQREQMVATVVEALETDGPLTRVEVQSRLIDAGLPATGFAVTLALGFAETSALVCSGPTMNGEQTYALLHERAPGARRLDRAESLSELTRRYVTSHGPVTEQDLAYWATLTLTDVRRGLDSIGELLASFDHDGMTYWHLRTDEPRPSPTSAGPEAHILRSSTRSTAATT